MNQRNHYDAALAVVLIAVRSNTLAKRLSNPTDRAEAFAIAAQLRNVSNALAGAEKCRCGLYHDEENVPESCRECAK